jgi:outer membrane autotransporter protein
MSKRHRIAHAMAATGLAWLAGAGAAQAQAGNPAYQSYFLSACVGATGPLATLCAASRGGQLSGDSESSLNPNQTSVTGSTALARAQSLATVTERRLEGIRDDEASGAAARDGAFSLFGNVQGEWSDQDRAAFANERGFDADTTRITVGLDYRLSPAATFGASLSFGDYSSDFDGNLPGNAFAPQADAGGMDSEDITITLFGTFALSPQVYLDATAGLGFADYDLSRNATFQESNRLIPQTNVRATASPDGREYFGSLGIGYDAEMEGLSLGPYARLRTTKSRIDGYAEADGGTGLGLRVSKSRNTSLVSILGLRASYAVSQSWGVIVPQARAEFEHEFDDDPRSTATSLLLDPARNAFRVTNDRPDRNSFNLGAGLLFVLPNGWMPYVDYEGLVGYRDSSRHRITAGLRVEF